MATDVTTERRGLSDAKVRVQQVGRFLSNMVMPNIAAFVAWGLITSFFIPTGWIPNEHMAKLVGPMITYLLPVLIGYTGGRLVGGDRGAVVGAIATMGVVIGAPMPMFLGAMIIGPLGGWAIAKFDAAVEGKVKAGFEMLVANFSAGIIGMIVAIIAYLLIGPVVSALSAWLGRGVEVLVSTGWIPLASLLVEPAKVLFLNNTINHGVFTPLGTQEALTHGMSLVFLIEANPGPGLGLLLAYFFFGRGVAKQSAPAAMIIHFLGGIHEIYFPFVLMKPRLIIAMIAGGMTGVFVLTLFHAGLRAPASPGSIFAVLLMTPSTAFVGVISSVVAACAVTFVVASALLKSDRSEVVAEGEDELGAATLRMQAMKAESKGQTAPAAPAAPFSGPVRRVVVACDAGMGSSAMGANMLQKKLAAAGLSGVRATNAAINSLPPDADIVVTQATLTDRARRLAPGARHVSIGNFLDGSSYDEVVRMIQASGAATPAPAPAAPVAAAPSSGFALRESDIFLGLKAETKEEAIRHAGQMLLEAGCIRPAYVEAMLAREKVVSTYLGQGLAMPHGTNEARGEVIKTGIVVCQYPEGVWFGGDKENVAHLVIGLAAQGDEHLTIISALASVLEKPKVMEHLSHTTSATDILRILELAAGTPPAAH